ncbi:MAG: Asp23/Gls24 family envelope stress response protein [Anaerolineae bacterium]|nr:Asp23/Gls24 family envelope stress response protein [Anaerolineae bacterium]
MLRRGGEQAQLRWTSCHACYNAHVAHDVTIGDQGVIVDVFVVVEYGIRITEVANSVMRRVYFTLTSKAGVPVAAVNVHVQELRVGDDAARKSS